MMKMVMMVVMFLLMDYWIIDDGRVWPRKKAMCMSELEDSDHHHDYHHDDQLVMIIISGVIMAAIKNMIYILVDVDQHSVLMAAMLKCFLKS